MEFINEANVCRTQYVQIDELSAVGRHGEILPCVEAFMLGVIYTHDYVFDTDAKFSLFVETWFIGDAHALLELELVVTTDSIRPLMHVQI